MPGADAIPSLVQTVGYPLVYGTRLLGRTALLARRFVLKNARQARVAAAELGAGQPAVPDVAFCLSLCAAPTFVSNAFVSVGTLRAGPSAPPTDARALRGGTNKDAVTVHDAAPAVASAVVSAAGVPPSVATAPAVPHVRSRALNAVTRASKVQARDIPCRRPPAPICASTRHRTAHCSESRSCHAPR